VQEVAVVLVYLGKALAVLLRLILAVEVAPVVTAELGLQVVT
jgi:hypothetical protein